MTVDDSHSAEIVNPESSKEEQASSALITEPLAEFKAQVQEKDGPSRALLSEQPKKTQAAVWSTKSTTISGIINKYTSVQGIQNSRELIVQGSEGFYPNDKVLIIQMQGALIDGTNTSSYGTVVDYNSSGLYEFGRIESVEPDRIRLSANLLNMYDYTGKVQIVRVPEYDDVIVEKTLTCQEWNGETGGILVLSAAGTVTLQADVDVSGKGFRGGEVGKQQQIISRFVEDYVGPLNPELYGMKGEGIAMYGVDEMIGGRGAPANGGGGGGNHNAGGGGGANGGCGGNGGYSYQHQRYNSGNYQQAQGLGGYPALQMRQRLFFGGGGGAGHSNVSPVTKTNDGTSGGNGGGMVLIEAEAIVSSGYRIVASGNDADDARADGAGGGGAGGSVALAVEYITEPLFVNVQGGRGGNTLDTLQRAEIGTGGGGGGGVVSFMGTTLPENLSVSLQGGEGGLTTEGNLYGSTQGCEGIILSHLELPGNLFDSRKRYNKSYHDSMIE